VCSRQNDKVPALDEKRAANQMMRDMSFERFCDNLAGRIAV
jgi:hypothetical protein